MTTALRNTSWEIQMVTDAGSTADKIALYDNNAASYDDYMASEQYNGPQMMAQMVHTYFHDQPDADILIVPAGTGNEIRELLKLGDYTNLTALDASAKMLEILKRRCLGDKHLQKLFVKNSGLPHDTYDAVVCVGGFMPQHLQCEALEEMCNILKPGGLALILCREAYLHECSDFADRLFWRTCDALEDAGRWTKVCHEIVPNYFGELTGAKFIYRKKDL